MDPKDFINKFIDKYKGMNPEDINIEDLFNGKFGNMFKDFLGMKGGKRGMQKNSLALIEQVQKMILMNLCRPLNDPTIKTNGIINLNI
jgi:hypothetical protein